MGCFCAIVAWGVEPLATPAGVVTQALQRASRSRAASNPREADQRVHCRSVSEHGSHYEPL